MFKDLLTDPSVIYEVIGDKMYLYDVIVDEDKLKKVVAKIRSRYSRVLSKSSNMRLVADSQLYVELFTDINKLFLGELDFLKKYDYYLDCHDETYNRLYIDYGDEIFEALTTNLLYSVVIKDKKEAELYKQASPIKVRKKSKDITS